MKEFVAQNLKQELITNTNGKILAIEAYKRTEEKDTEVQVDGIQILC
jgi:hypothetical protein